METKIKVQRFFNNDLKKFQAKHLWHAQALIFILLSVPPSSNGPLPLKAPSLSSHFGPHHFCQILALRLVCLCCKGPHPLCFNLDLIKDHYFFILKFSYFRFIFAMHIFFDGVLAKSKFAFLFKTHLGHHSSIWSTFQLVGFQTWYLSTFKIYLTQKTRLTTFLIYS